MPKVLYIIYFAFAICSMRASPTYDLSDSLTLPESILKAQVTLEHMTIDGALEEAAWSSADKTVLAQEHYPQNARVPLQHTEIMMTRDDRNLYVAMTCFDQDQNYVVQTLKRDFDMFGNDGVVVLLDPSGQKNSAYFFGVSAKGVQAEGIITRFDFDANWDSKWYSGVKHYNDRWTVEFAIPLHIMRFDPTNLSWNLNFIRSDVKNYRFYSWTKIPQQYDGIDLGYLGKLDWHEPLPPSSGHITMIPYANLNGAKDYEDVSNSKNKIGLGADAKITLSSSLNLDLTINPDFSQVEVDRQVTNLTRFNVFFPERRNFFLDNADLFSQFGDPENPIFFSRRIGLDDDGNSVPILGGARLTGNIGQTWRVGALAMQSKATDSQKGQNYSAFTLHKKVLKRSLIKGIFTNRQGMTGKEFSSDDYGRNASVEGVYQNLKGSILSWVGLHKSYKQNLAKENGMYSTGIWFNGKNFNTITSFSATGTNYTADMGFVNQLENYDAARDTVIRVGYKNVSNSLRYQWRTPKSRSINFHNFEFSNSIKLLADQSINEWNLRAGYEIEFKSSSELELKYSHNYTKLLFPFSFTDEVPLPAARYDYSQIALEFQSDSRKKFGLNIEGVIGGFYNGTIKSLELGFNYRAQPWGNFEMNIEYNDVAFPSSYGRAEFLLINPRIEFNFSKSLFWTTFLQYNTQADNFNVNSRLQWRYKPMSDIFLVYTDNYAVQFWGPKSRSLVLKMNYWLNI